MNKNILTKGLLIIAVSTAVCAVSSIDAFAWGGWPGRSHDRERVVLPPRHEIVRFGDSRYHYYRGRFYHDTFFGLVFVHPPVGVIIDLIPAESRVVTVGASTYYCYDNVYYEACSSGYIVVPAPSVNYASVFQPVTVPSGGGETIEINVPNSNGSYTAVKVRKSNNGYIGPQGEFYPAHPTVEQLKVLYGN